MSVSQDKNGTYYAKIKCTTPSGRRIDTTKRGFPTREEAEAWAMERTSALSGLLNMPLRSFIRDCYFEEIKGMVRESTFINKRNIIETHVIPHLGNVGLIELSVDDVRLWQDRLLVCKEPNTGKPYSKSYLKTVNLQLTAILSHAVKYYKLPVNVACTSQDATRESCLLLLGMIST